MKATKKIFIHIGQHKTGSTSIQQALYNNSDTLKKNNLFYYRKKPNGKKDAHVSSWIKPIRSDDYDDLAIIIQPEKLAIEVSKLPGNVIISSEEFSWVQNKDVLSRFKNSLKKYFDSIVIITYIRRQDSQVVSYCQEEAKSGGGMKESRFFQCENRAVPKYKKYYDRYLDYNTRLSKWADVFKDENLFIRIFDKNHLYNEDVVLDFFKLIGIKKDIQSARFNASWGFEKTKIVYLMEKNKMNKYFKNIIYQNLDNSSKLLPSRCEAMEFYSFYRESNKKLNSRFSLNSTNDSIFDEDFSIYPEESGDIWTEESANKAISNIICTINSINPSTLFYILIKTKLFQIKQKIKGIIKY